MKQNAIFALGIVIGLFALLPSHAHAGADCQNATTQLQLDECAGASYAKSDKALNKVYREILSRLKGPSETKTDLIAAQRAWLKYRDAECKFEVSGLDGGSVQPMIYSQCLDALTQSRTKGLSQFLDCSDGTLNCPIPRKGN